MNNLSPDKLTDIHTFFDQSVDRNFYYRIFDNKKFEKERCIIFVSGTKKNKDNLYTQIVDGVACSTEIKLNHNNIQKILSLIKITKIWSKSMWLLSVYIILLDKYNDYGRDIFKHWI